ncbi:hypothetical protein AB0B66_38375 [Catellatospora sp. NPDC049111]|uniref:hypothetical protein n=1 Tax=Catellatospora sp. NPDC049111 TaxID=3155271 RepID=UPI003407634D
MSSEVLEDHDGLTKACYINGHTLREIFAEAATWVAANDGLYIDGITLENLREGEDELGFKHQLKIFYTLFSMPT